ncbi:GNAT family N-acetyltransferase [Actinophytocola oryzae]|uniref:Acetyltransferase (GNAT) family protein n=1 Tax=Actinophytocola oryzae TaxID=502181 RepID=A0A4R7VW93_9PSEU|nr:GNAT family N-acetyltransferase [Actinophytocola oryzae]TDV53749.1 acetyltransferase (GNAT) family protein [Actinophytocola oryzae]
MSVEIRKYQPGEERVLYDICLLTGDSGVDATGLYRDPLLLGEVYVGPYLRYAPEHALVGVDEGGVAGYVLGVLDTVAFEEECERSWWPPLRARYPLSRFGQETADARVVRLIHNPPRTSPDVVERYPAHLHIDLLPRVQGQGDGRRLLTALLDGLAAAGVPGVHLGVSLANQRAIGFYERLGFTEVRAYSHSLVMARKL